MKEIYMPDLSSIGAAASEFIAAMQPGRVYAFYAPMGAGKTTFISEVVDRLGSADEANSPTFSIANVYDTEKWGRIYHLDCYRIETEEEAYDMGIEDYFCGPHTAFVEWPERVEAFLPEDAVTVNIEADESGRRTIRIQD